MEHDASPETEFEGKDGIDLVSQNSFASFHSDVESDSLSHIDSESSVKQIDVLRKQEEDKKRRLIRMHRALDVLACRATDENPPSKCSR